MNTLRPSGIELRNVSKAYGGQRGTVAALHDISLSIPAGQFVTLLGPSGCGKSTLLFLIAGLDVPTYGQVLFGGRPVLGPSRDRTVVFQDYALFPWRTVLGNVTIGLEGRIEVSRREVITRAREYIELVGLQGFEQHYPHQLSGGMRQRAALARSLAMRPTALLMDEPFAAVDAQTRETLQQELLRIWERARLTIVFVTHSVEEAIFLGQRVVVMSSRPGRVKADLEIDEPYPRLYGFRTSPLASRLRGHLHDQLLESAPAAP